MKKKNILAALICIVFVATIFPIHVANAAEYIWPTDNHTLSRGFASHGNKAIDIAVPTGIAVYASKSGTVYAAYTGCYNHGGINNGQCRSKGCQPSSGFSIASTSRDYCNNGFGNGVIIRHDDGTYAHYAHMSSIAVSRGAYVSQGSVIGYSGDSGYCTGACLHFELHRAGASPWKGSVINPVTAIEGSGTNVISGSANTGVADSVTETSAVLRGSFSTTGAPAKECGMYLGESRDAMTKLGSDAVNTYGTTMYYSTSKYGRTLKPGTTYYYQAYVLVGNSSNLCKGEIKSFTTLGTSEEPYLKLDKTHLDMTKNGSIQIITTTKPADMQLSWSSSNSAVARVDNNGVVTAVSDGNATINVSGKIENGVLLTICSVSVKDNEIEPKIVLDKTNITLNEGENVRLIATTVPSEQVILWNSSNPSVISVDHNGTITALNAGNATVEAVITYKEKTSSASCLVTVLEETKPEPPEINVYLPVSGVSNVSANTARVDASCSYSGVRPSSVGLYLGTTPSNMTAWGSDDINHNKNPFNIWYNLNGLSTGTTYYYKFYAMVNGQTVESETYSFTTAAAANTRIGVVVNTDGEYLAINDRPASSSAGKSIKLGRIPPGGQITVYPDKTSGNWYWVEYGGVSGYAYNRYIALQ